jgi:hypothetical protein
MSDTVTWILNAALRPPQLHFDAVSVVNSGNLAFHFSAAANLDYLLQSRTNLSPGAWTTLRDFSSAPYDRSIWVTNVIIGVSPRFYRLVVGP